MLRIHTARVVAVVADRQATSDLPNVEAITHAVGTFDAAA
jgi:hypothetical protein